MTKPYSLKLGLSLFAFGLVGCQSIADPVPTDQVNNSVTYVQAGEGSYNHQAISRLSQHEGVTPEYKFSGTPLHTFQKADSNHTQAFVALRNDIVKGHLIEETVKAVQQYKITHVTAAVAEPIAMCLLRTKTAISQQLPLKAIASHPAALAQVTKWKSGKALSELSEPKGTSEAARLLSVGAYPETTAAIGSCMLPELYPSLSVAEYNIQDIENNTTLFGRFYVEKREKSISKKDAIEALKAVIDEAYPLSEWSKTS